MISPEIDHAFPQNLLLKTACHRCEEKQILKNSTEKYVLKNLANSDGKQLQ